jgi:prepilin-type N-terminal cleavage/methylation domain-containing protein
MRSAAIKIFNSKPVLAGADQAYSLIEVLIAMAIFSIGVLAVATLVLSTARNNINGNNLTEATMLARAKIEEKKREADAGTLSEVCPETESNIDTEGNPGGIYDRVCCINSGASGTQIRVTVSWTRQGRSRSVVMTTLN